MTEHATCYEIHSSREASPSGLRPDSTFTQRVQVVANEASTTSDPIPYPIIPPSAHGGAEANILAQHVNFNWATESTLAIGSAMAGQQEGVLDGVTLDNGGNDIISVEAPQSSGRQSPRMRLRFSGGLMTALQALTGTSTVVDIVLQQAYRQQAYTGLAHFIEFEDQPPDSPGDGEVRTRALLKQIIQSGNTTSLGTTTGGTEIVLNRCGFAGIAPEGVVYLEAGDLGPNEEQIPDDPADNNAAHYRFHPSVFLPSGRTNYVRALDRSYSDTDPLTLDTPQALGIVVVNNPVSSSKWLIIVDGNPQLVRVIHPAGTDFRRPRDIWNNVWVPILTGSQSTESATSFAEVVGAPSAGYISSRLQYGDYFRCLGLPGNFTQQSVG